MSAYTIAGHAAVLLELILQGVAKRTYHLQLKDHVFRSISIAAPTPGMEPSDVAGWGPNDGSWARMKFRCIPTFDLSNSVSHPRNLSGPFDLFN